MSYRTTAGSIIILCLFCVTAFSQTTTRRSYSRADFVNIDGANLNEKIGRAVKQFKDSKVGETVWLAYHFPMNEQVSIGPFSGTIYRDDDGIHLERRDDPQGAAVLVLANTTGAQPVYSRVATLNLSEPYVFDDRPVYWLGNIEASDSVAFLEGIVRSRTEDKNLVRGALRAVSAHTGPRVVPLLKDFAEKDANADTQRAAISYLGRVKTKESVDTLMGLYDSFSVQTLKEEVIAQLARSNARSAVEKLLAIAKNDGEPKLRQAAIRRLSTSQSSRYLVDWR